jgi:hypothetical protein
MSALADIAAKATNAHITVININRFITFPPCHFLTLRFNLLLIWYKLLSVKIPDHINHGNGGKPTVLAVRDKRVVFGPKTISFCKKVRKFLGKI